MEKRISYMEFQQVRSVAKACDPAIRQRDRIKAKIEQLVAEYKKEEEKIAMLEAGIKQVIGFSVEQLVKKVIEPTGKTDPKTGKALTVTKYLPTENVSYDEETKEYIITLPDAEPECPTPEEDEVTEETAE
jgi:hypothetical protein